MARKGAEAAENWAEAVVANMARKPQGGDRGQLRAVAAGECDIAIANTYYYARLAGSDKSEDRQVTEKVALFLPNQAGRGAHVHISGSGVTAHAPTRAQAIRLI